MKDACSDCPDLNRSSCNPSCYGFPPEVEQDYHCNACGVVITRDEASDYGYCNHCTKKSLKRRLDQSEKNYIELSQKHQKLLDKTYTDRNGDKVCLTCGASSYRDFCDACMSKEYGTLAAMGWPTTASGTVNKISLIKHVRSKYNLGLKEAKDAVEKCLIPGHSHELLTALEIRFGKKSPTYGPLRQVDEDCVLEYDENRKLAAVWLLEGDGMFHRRAIGE